MGELSRIAAQIKHYRELARIAVDCAGKNPAHRADYLELAKQWDALADGLEGTRPESERAGLASIQDSKAEAGLAGR